MVLANSIDRSEFGPTGKSRFDAEAVLKSDLDLERALLSLGGRRLASLVEDSRPKKFVAEKEGEVQYVSISSVDSQDGSVFPEPMPVEELPGRAKWRVATGDVLISQVRPERGAVALVSKSADGAIASSGFYLIKASEMEDDLAAAVFLFFRGATARSQLIRRNRNSMYPAVGPQDVEALVVPAFSPEQLVKCQSVIRSVHRAHEKLTGVRQQLHALMDSLLITTGTPPSPTDTRKVGPDTTTVSWSEAFGDSSAERIDAEFFRSEYKDYHDGIAAADHFKLGDFFELRAGQKADGDDPIPVFKQSLLTNFGPNFSVVELEFCKKKNDPVVKAGDILLASTAHEIAYVGKKVDLVRAIPEHLEQNQAVAELMVLRPKSGVEAPVSSSFIVDFLRHEAGRYQVQRCIRGLRGGHTYARDLTKYVLVPRPDDQWMADYEALSSRADGLREKCITLTQDGTRWLQESLELEVSIHQELETTQPVSVGSN